MLYKRIFAKHNNPQLFLIDASVFVKVNRLELLG